MSRGVLIWMSASVLLFVGGCGNDKDTLTADEVRQALDEVPYQVTLEGSQEGENARGEVLVGTAKNQYEIRLDFAIAVGGAVIPNTLMDRLGITGATSSEKGWSEAYGINPGLTGADLVREARNPERQAVDPTSRELERRRGKMESRIEDALCTHVDCKFFPD
jgi:hypothetical protein